MQAVRKKQTNDLGADPVRPLVWRIAIPAMLAQFVSVLYSVVDRIYVGNIPEVGETALAGVGVSGPVVTMLGAAAFWIGGGGAPLLGISLGEGNVRRARDILSNCFMLLCAAAVTLAAAALALQRPMLYLFGASDITYPYARQYFTIYVSGTLFALLANGLNQFVISQGFARQGMCAIAIGALANIALDPLFIFVLDMGVSGAALATVLSQAAGATYVVWFLRRRSPVRLGVGGYSRAIIRRVLSLGVGPFIIIALDNVMLIAMNALLQRYGGAARGDSLVTCNTVVQSFMLLLTLPLCGISGGTQGIISFNYGAGKTQRLQAAQRNIAALAAGYGGLLTLLAWAAGPLFVRLFTQQEALGALAVRAIRISTLAALPLGVQYVLVDGFTAVGQLRFSLPLSLWRKLVYFAAIFALPAAFGAEAAFWAEPLADIAGPLVTVLVYFPAMRQVLNRRLEVLSWDAAPTAETGGEAPAPREEDTL